MSKKPKTRRDKSLQAESEAEEKGLDLANRIHDIIDERVGSGLSSDVRQLLLIPPENRKPAHIMKIYNVLKPMGVYAKIPHCQTKDMAFELTKTATLHHFREKVTLFAQGDPGDSFYIILEGSVRIWILDRNNGREITLATRSAVNVIGETAVETRGKRGAFVSINETGTLMLRIGVDEFWKAISPFIDEINNDKASVLARLELLKDVEYERILQLASKISLRTYFPNHLITNQGILLHEAYVVMKGEAALTQAIWTDAPPTTLPFVRARDNVGEFFIRSRKKKEESKSKTSPLKGRGGGGGPGGNDGANWSGSGSPIPPSLMGRTASPALMMMLAGARTGSGGNNSAAAVAATWERVASAASNGSGDNGGGGGGEDQRRWYALPSDGQIHDLEGRAHQMASTARNWYDLQGNFRRATDAARPPFPLTYTAHGLTLSLETVELKRCWRGDFIGSSALLLKPKEHPYTAVAITRVQVMVITRNELTKVLTEAELAKWENALQSEVVTDLRTRHMQLKSLAVEDMTWRAIKQEVLDDIYRERADKERVSRLSCFLETHYYKLPPKPKPPPPELTALQAEKLARPEPPPPRFPTQSPRTPGHSAVVSPRIHPSPPPTLKKLGSKTSETRRKRVTMAGESDSIANTNSVRSSVD